MTVEPTGQEPRTLVRWVRSSGVLLPSLLIIVLIVTATWFSNSQGVEDIANQSTVALRAESTLSAAASLRNQVALAYVIAQAKATGAATTADVEGAARNAERAMIELERRQAGLLELERLPPGIAPPVTDLLTASTGALEQLKAGETASAAVSMQAVESAYAQVESQLSAVRQSVFADIAVARETAGRVAGAARIVVAFLLPFAAVLAYRTAIRRAQRRRRLREALEHERALVLAKDELIANLSHELRTPLTGIVGFAQTAVLDTSLDAAELREMSGVIASEANELSRMVDDLITAARDDQDSLSIRLETVDPERELEAVLVAAKLADYKVRTDIEPAAVTADRLRLRQILRNLVSNAIKHGGTDVAVEGTLERDTYRIVVSDDGEGVPEHLAGRLFERFIHRGDSPITVGSVGLGLSIARRLAELMDGSLTYARNGGRTEFILQLPATPPGGIPDPWS